MTLEMWTYWWSVPSSIYAIFTTDGSFTSPAEHLNLKPSANSVAVSYGIAGDTNALLSPTLPLNTWTYITVTHNASFNPTFSKLNF